MYVFIGGLRSGVCRRKSTLPVIDCGRGCAALANARGVALELAAEVGAAIAGRLDAGVAAMFGDGAAARRREPAAPDRRRDSQDAGVPRTG